MQLDNARIMLSFFTDAKGAKFDGEVRPRSRIKKVIQHRRRMKGGKK